MNKYKNNCCCECNKKWEEKRPTFHNCGCQHEEYEKKQSCCELNCWFEGGNNDYQENQCGCGYNNYYTQGY
ncbi:MAG: hypothetical protein IKV94_00330 [Clostridia bacterium]|nr:hypothetical protein [Clostridia bacterium]